VIPDFKLGFPEASYSPELDSSLPPNTKRRTFIANTQPAASQSSLGNQPPAGINRLLIVDLALSASLM
jgi:hypothetical protein